MVTRYLEPVCPTCGRMFKPEQNDSGKYMKYKDYEALLEVHGLTKIMKRQDIKKMNKTMADLDSPPWDED